MCKKKKNGYNSKFYVYLTTIFKAYILELDHNLNPGSATNSLCDLGNVPYFRASVFSSVEWKKIMIPISGDCCENWVR